MSWAPYFKVTFKNIDILEFSLGQNDKHAQT